VAHTGNSRNRCEFSIEIFIGWENLVPEGRKYAAVEENKGSMIVFSRD
jgi:hypothetical protein